MIRPKILVTGANGQLGRELRMISHVNSKFEIIFFSREELSIDRSDLIQEIFATLKPQYCINCAAYTAVDKAETEKERAFLINGTSTGILAAACNTLGVKFIHISTDYVFDGNATQPYREDDSVDPVNAYGASKLQGELLALAENRQSIIIRTSWVYSEYGNNFVKTMIRLMKERASLGVVNDQWGSPTYAADLAKVIMDIIAANEWKPGVFHYSNDGIITWYEFAVSIAALIKTGCKVTPIVTADFPTPAKRPRFSGFDKQKIKTSYSLTIPDWEKSLRICLRKLVN